MIVELYGLLTTADYDSELKIGRLYVESEEEVDELVQTLDSMVRKIPKRKQYICEYRWEKVED